MLVGQIYNKKLVSILKKSNSFPRFMIITGEKGSGKKLLARYIAKQGIGGYVINCENGVDAVRDAVVNSYKCSTPTTYIFSDTDKMSVQAKNALLKVTEEPPKQAYFIMTLEDINGTLGTLKSRGTEIPMDHYSKEDLAQFTTNTTILEIATNPGQVKQLEDIDVEKFVNFCEKVIENIGKVTGVNALKIANSFKFKDEEEGYDPILFFNTLIYLYRKRITETSGNEVSKLVNSISTCSNFKNEFRITGLKKDSTFDMFLLNLREIWREN